MTGSYAVPIITMTGLSFFNKWYADGSIDLKIPLMGGVAYVLAGMFSEVPGLEPVITGIAWVALAAAVVVPLAQGQKSILDPLLSIGNK